VLIIPLSPLIIYVPDLGFFLYHSQDLHREVRALADILHTFENGTGSHRIFAEEEERKMQARKLLQPDPLEQAMHEKQIRLFVSHLRESKHGAARSMDSSAVGAQATDPVDKIIRTVSARERQILQHILREDVHVDRPSTANLRSTSPAVASAGMYGAARPGTASTAISSRSSSRPISSWSGSKDCMTERPASRSSAVSATSNISGKAAVADVQQFLNAFDIDSVAAQIRYLIDGQDAICRYRITAGTRDIYRMLKFLFIHRTDPGWKRNTTC